MSSSPAEFQFGRVTVTETRTVEITIATSSLLTNATGGVFRPDTLRIQYKDGRVLAATLRGPMMRPDGKRYSNDRRGYQTFDGTSQAQTPEWIRREVARYLPKGL